MKDYILSNKKMLEIYSNLYKNEKELENFVSQEALYNSLI